MAENLVMGLDGIISGIYNHSMDSVISGIHERIGFSFYKKTGNIIVESYPKYNMEEFYEIWNNQ